MEARGDRKALLALHGRGEPWGDDNGVEKDVVKVEGDQGWGAEE